MPQIHRDLPRLKPEAYRGFVSVHWIHTIESRETGWLDPNFHHSFREALLHSLSRYQLACPVYCLMPDHIHLLATGLNGESDQRLFSKHFRRSLNVLLDPHSLQNQAYDHVLRKEESDTDAFVSIAHYILENPVRNELCGMAHQYSYSGALFPGYFGLDPHHDDFWDRYWKIYNRFVSNR